MKNFSRRRAVVCFSFIVLLCLLFLSSCKESFSDIDSVFDSVVLKHGGKIAVISDSSEPPGVFAALYGRGGEFPDELSLIEYGEIWYSERFEGGDAAVFFVRNATDADSLAKMCNRRAKTLKYSVGVDCEIAVKGHYVIFINCGGELADIGENIEKLISG